MPAVINVKDLTIELQRIANTAIDSGSENRHALDLEPLVHWLFWESENDGGDEIFVAFSDLDLSDYALLDELEDKSSIINNEMRIVFSLNALKTKIDELDLDCVFACSWRIERDTGERVYVCCNMIIAGQGGPEIDNFCLHPTPAAFWEDLKQCGYHHVGDPIENIDVQKILEHWEHDLPPRIVYSRKE